MRKWFGSLLVMLLIATLGTPTTAAWPEQFKDVLTWPEWAAKGRWITQDEYSVYGGELAEAVWWELMVGDPPTDGNSYSLRTFRPDDTITRAEYAIILARALGIEAKQSTDAAWYQPTVDGLRERGIITAAGNFDTPITRREMGDWVGRAIRWYGVDLAGKSELTFSDIDGLAEAPYIKIASRAEVIKGYPDGTYGPEKTATRAEAGVMAVRVAKQLKKHPPQVDLFEKLDREQWAVVTAADKAMIGQSDYIYGSRLEPYLSPMLLYGPDGVDVGLKFMFAFKTWDTYREMVNTTYEPIFMRDTVAVIKGAGSIRRVRLDGTVMSTITTSSYLYYVKRGDTWISTNGKGPGDFPSGALPMPEVILP